MNKNILILFLSPIRKCNKIKYEIHIGNKPYSIEAAESSEPVAKYLINKLKHQGEQLDNIYAICSNKIRENLDNDSKNSFEYFQEDIIRKYCNTENFSVPKVVEINYNEDCPFGEASFRSVLELSKKIQNDCGDCDNIEMFVDITGGFRDTSMLMVAIMRIFEFQNFEIGQVLYANMSSNQKNPSRLADTTEIYKLYNLIAGAEEFTSYGSVEDIKKHYENRKISKPLQKLLEAMDNFSKTMKICHVDDFEEKLKELKECIENFKKLSNKNLEDQIFELLIIRIEKEYKPILKDTATLPEYIRWCVERDYLQQAVTIFNEKLTQYLVEQGILMLEPEENLSESDMIKDIKEVSINKKQSWWTWQTRLYKDYKKINNGTIVPAVRGKVRVNLRTGTMKKIDKIYNSIHYGLRNKVNHAANTNKSYIELKESLLKKASEIEKFIEEKDLTVK